MLLWKKVQINYEFLQKLAKPWLKEFTNLKQGKKLSKEEYSEFFQGHENLEILEKSSNLLKTKISGETEISYRFNNIQKFFKLIVRDWTEEGEEERKLYKFLINEIKLENFDKKKKNFSSLRWIGQISLRFNSRKLFGWI